MYPGANRNSIAVVYLARGLPGGLDAVRSFFASYETYDPGILHSLRVVVKGWDAVPGLDVVTKLAGRFGAEVIPLQDDGYDFGAYFRAIPGVQERWICLLNTNSRIRSRNWLAYLFEGASRDDVGAAGATGSWESQFRNAYLGVASGGISLAARSMGRTAYNWLHFQGFPNPHLRSNAILTQTALFKEFASNCIIPRCKRDAHILESGRTGFSAFLRRRRLKPVVCGANGNIYYPAEWPASATFRSLGQRNLLVADNQTLQYESQPSAVRYSLQLAAWGRSIDNPSMVENSG
jgi:hypothetical protein